VFAEGTKNVEIISGLKKNKNDVLIKKNKISPFYKTTLEKELKGINKVEGNPQFKTVDVQWDSPATEAQIRATLNDINFPAV
jgi:nicotinamidase-related amidase